MYINFRKTTFIFYITKMWKSAKGKNLNFTNILRNFFRPVSLAVKYDHKTGTNHKYNPQYYAYIYSSNIHIYITSTYSYGTYTSCSSRILHKQGFKEKPSQDFFYTHRGCIMYTKKKELSFEKLMLKRKNNILKIYRNCQFKVKLFKIVSYLCTIVLIILVRKNKRYKIIFNTCMD